MNKIIYLDVFPARRRLLAAGIALPALAWTRALRAQATPPVLIGWLEASARGTYRMAAFKEGMAAHGWKEGEHYVLEAHWAAGNMDRLPELAAEIAAKKPAIVVTAPSDATRHMARAAPSTPIVQANGGPSLIGLIKSLAHPGGMVTGVTNINTETGAKLVELLHDAMPDVRRIGYLADTSSNTTTRGAHLAEIRRAAEHYRLELKVTDVSLPQNIDAALAPLARERIQALIVGNSAWFWGERERIVKFALAQRWPVISSLAEFTNAGALASYGADRYALYQRSAYFVDRILKGAKPGDLPIERPIKFETVVNLKTARALGLTMPQSVMVRANRVLE